jgi:hypothetical protein
MKALCTPLGAIAPRTSLDRGKGAGENRLF